MKFKYPLKTHKTGGFYPESGGCGYCGKSNSENKFIVITMSAMEQFGSSNVYTPADVETSFQLIDHGVTKTGKGITVFKNTSDVFFCSTNCLRDFFNTIVDDFELGK